MGLIISIMEIGETMATDANSLLMPLPASRVRSRRAGQFRQVGH